MTTNQMLPVRIWLLLFLGAIGLLCGGVALADQLSPERDSFCAYYTRVRSGEPFERYCRTGDDADIVVNVGAAAGRLVFGRGRS